jgi:ferredoxin
VTGGFSFDVTAAAPVAGGWRIGENVPWTVSWTGEQHFELAISQDFPGCVDLVQAGEPGQGAPRFRALHVTRHRLGMAALVCHVCGQPTSKRDRYIFPVQSGGMAIMPDESMRYAGNVPPVHRDCANRAAHSCPHLKAAFAVPVAYPAEPSRLMPRTDVVPGVEDVARHLPSQFKIVFTCYRLFGPKFTAQVQRLRREYGVDDGAAAG